jgi:hypothetical protein
MQPVSQPAIRALADWSCQTVRYTLGADYFEHARKSGTPLQRVDFTDQSVTITRELFNRTQQFVDSSSTSVALDITVIIYTLNWSAEKLGFSLRPAKRPWWSRLSFGSKKQKSKSQSSAKVACIPNTPMSEKDAAAMSKWSYLTVNYCLQASKLQNDRSLIADPKLYNSEAEAKEVAQRYWSLTADRCKGSPGAAFDAYYIEAILHWCAHQRGYSR